MKDDVSFDQNIAERENSSFYEAGNHWVYQSLFSEYPVFVQFARERLGSLIIHKAWMEFSAWLESNYRRSPEDHLFIPWYLFLWRPSRFVGSWPIHRGEALTIGECYVRETSEAGFGHSVVAQSEALYMSFYRVIEVRSDLLLLEDMFLGQRFETIRPPYLSPIMEQIIFAMRFQYEGRSYLLGSSQPLEGEIEAPISQIGRWLNEFRTPCSATLREISSELFEIYNDFKNAKSSC